jgi:hypothetical protein
MATATVGTRPTTRDLGLDTDAYFAEERAQLTTATGAIAKNTQSGGVLNKFDFPLPSQAWKTVRTTFVNPLQDPSIALRPEQGPPQPSTYAIFRPSGLAGGGNPTDEVPVTLFVGPGRELNRHGLRSAFEANGKAALVALPGKESSPKFGFGITQAQLVSLFAQAGIVGVPRVRVIAGFSTGYRGVNGIINNTKSVRTPPAAMATGANPGTGLDLSGVTKVIYYDAFYQADDPGPAPKVSGLNTNRALTAILAEAGSAVELILYDVTSGGTAHPLQAKIPAGMVTRQLQIKPAIVRYNALILARLIDVAIQDGFTDAAEVAKFGGQAVLDLIDAGLPSRGTVGSAPGSGATDVTSWQTTSKPKSTGARTLLASAAAQRLAQTVIGPHQLMGWSLIPGGATTPQFSELQHDAHLFEFAWEHLVP